MKKKLFEMFLTSVFALVLGFVALVGGITVAYGAKALEKGDLGRQDFYDMFVAVVADLTTLKSAVDELIGDDAGLVALANETSADLTTDSTAVSAIANETSADLTTDATNLATLANQVSARATLLAILANELSDDHATVRTMLVELQAIYNGHIGATIGGGVHNGTPGASLINTPPATLTAAVVANVSAPDVNASARAASVATPATRTASTVVATISNTTGTLGATTP